jgi:exonuclease III
MHQTQGHPSTFKKDLTALRVQTDTTTVILGDLNTSLSSKGRSSRQKINNETSELLHTLDQIDMFDIYKVFYPEPRQYTFFSAAHGTFSKTDHNLGHKGSLKKFQ